MDLVSIDIGVAVAYMVGLVVLAQWVSREAAGTSHGGQLARR
jgi:hypothetical protein